MFREVPVSAIILLATVFSSKSPSFIQPSLISQYKFDSIGYHLIGLFAYFFKLYPPICIFDEPSLLMNMENIFRWIAFASYRLGTKSCAPPPLACGERPTRPAPARPERSSWQTTDLNLKFYIHPLPYVLSLLRHI